MVRSVRRALRGTLIPLLMPNWPTRISHVGRAVASTLVVGFMLAASPALAQDDDYDLSSPPWKRTTPKTVQWSPIRGSDTGFAARPKSREVPTEDPRSQEVPTEVSRVVARRESSRDAESRVTAVEYQETDSARTPSPVEQPTPPHFQDPVDVAPDDDTPWGDQPMDGYGSEPCYPYPCDSYAPRCSSFLYNRLWVRGEYLLWWTKGSHLPPLVTTSTQGTQIGDAGVLGRPGTSILFGDGTVNTDANSGGRILLGYWFDDGCSTGVEVSYLGLGREKAHFSAASSEVPIIARPFYDTQHSAHSAMLTAYPDYAEGAIDCNLTSEFQAVELLFRRNMFRGHCNRIDLLLGWRYAQLDESLRIDQFSRWPESQGPIAAGTTKNLYDAFDTRNKFNGAELGFVYRTYAGRWSLETVMKLGLGCTHSRVSIDGLTTTTVPNVGSSNFTGDLLAQETNIGQYSHNRFAVVPELGVTLSYALTNRLHATFGYTFLYWSQVARPGDQLDTNASQLPPETPTGSRQPAFHFLMSDYWAQGMNFGLEYCF